MGKFEMHLFVPSLSLLLCFELHRMLSNALDLRFFLFSLGFVLFCFVCLFVFLGGRMGGFCSFFTSFLTEQLALEVKKSNM